MDLDLDTPAGTLHLVVDGADDAPPVLVLHGITQSTRTWDWLVPHLSDRRVVRLDFRGHGRSLREDDGAYAFPGYVDDAVAAVEQLIGGPTVVVGHSLGGATAAALAQQRPDLVAGVVLEDPPLAPPAGDGTPQTLREDSTLLAGFSMMRESVPQLQASGLSEDELAAILGGSPMFGGEVTFGDALHDDAVAAMAAGMLALDARVLDPVLQGTARPSFDPHRALPVPGIVVSADPAAPDRVTQPADLERLAEHSPHVEARVATGCGHLIHDSRTHRHLVLEAVRDLLDRLG